MKIVLPTKTDDGYDAGEVLITFDEGAGTIGVDFGDRTSGRIPLTELQDALSAFGAFRRTFGIPTPLRIPYDYTGRSIRPIRHIEVREPEDVIEHSPDSRMASEDELEFLSMIQNLLIRAKKYSSFFSDGGSLKVIVDSDSSYVVRVEKFPKEEDE